MRVLVAGKLVQRTFEVVDQKRQPSRSRSPTFERNHLETVGR